MNNENAIIINGVRYDLVENKTDKPDCNLCALKEQSLLRSTIKFICGIIFNKKHHAHFKLNTDEKD